MQQINVQGMQAEALNQMIRTSKERKFLLCGVNGQRYIGCGLKGYSITIEGTAGNATGALNDGSEIVVHGNVQDQAGDTMNGGSIIVTGSAGDALGYAMRGGEILVGGSVGYRCGIHMKAYQERQPLIVIGGSAGSFLGEYQAGGTIVVLGMHASGSLVGPCCARGMYGGTIFLAGDKPEDLPDKVLHRDATSEDMEHISRLIEPYCHRFRLDKESLLALHFSVLEPNSSNPYRQLYTYA